MNNNKLLIISIILMLIAIPASYAADGDYTIPQATSEVTVQDDGLTIISEDIIYSIEGSVNGVYRDIPHDKEQKISNITVETPGYYNKVEIIEDTEKTRIKVWLYKDEAKTQKIYDENVEVIYNYNFHKGVKIYNDIAELQYMSWGKEWDSGVDNLRTIIHIPGSNKDTEYWNNPDDNVISSSWTSDNTLETQLQDIGSHTLFEQRILMPKSYFKSGENAKIINMDAKAQIEQDQRKYSEDRNFQHSISQLISGILVILMIIPVGIYLLFGREPKIMYKADYEYDLPTNSSPIEVNSIVPGDVGELDQNAMYSVILELIDKKYFKIMSSNDEDTIIRQINTDMGGLKQYEQSLISYLSKFSAGNGDISLKSIGDDENPEEYQDFKNAWINVAKNEVPESLINKYFIDKGSQIFILLAILLLVIGIISLIIYMIYDFTVLYSFMILVLSILMIVESIIMMGIPNTFAGRWTPEGKEYHDKWKNFEKYITDFSLIKERPPASIQVWGKYLIYATALGCAKEVTENMQNYFKIVNVSDEYYYQSDVVRFAYFSGFYHMESSFSSLSHTDSDSSGIGSVGGGGFGGGGGGTF